MKLPLDKEKVTAACRWKFVPYKPEEWHGVSGSFMYARDRWYCAEHHTDHYGGENEPPPMHYCYNELVARWRRDRAAAWRRRWWLLKTLPHRLWLTLLGREHKDCE